MLIGCTLIPSKVQKPASTPNPGKGQVEPVSSPVLPAPPPSLAVSLSNPQESARILADALAGPDKLAGWLGLYEALGVPVIGQDGLPLGKTGEDPIGPRFWLVWYASGLDKAGHGIRLSDAGRLLVTGYPEMDSLATGPLLLNDLKLAAQSSDPQVRLLGAFVRERVLRGPSHVDLLAVTATPESAVIDLPTVQLLGWLALRGALIKSPGTAALPGRPIFVDYRLGPLPIPREAVPPQTPCSDKFGGDDAARMTERLVGNNAKDYLQLPAVLRPVPGMIAAIQRALGMDSKGLEEVSKLLKNRLSHFASTLVLAMDISSLEINNLQDPDPLVRTKGTSDGNVGRIIWALYSEPDQSSDGKALAACFAIYASTLGMPFSLPPDGRIARAKLEFKGGQGFTDLVQFADIVQGSSGPRDLEERFTDANGEVRVNVTGRGQNRQLPDEAKEVDKKFSIRVSAHPVVTGAQGGSLVNVFFGGMKFPGVNPGRGGFQAAVDTLQNVHWDLGEHVFNLTDWELKGYRASGTVNDATFSGVVCDLSMPFSINTEITSIIEYPTKFVPSSPTAGTASFQWTRISIQASGSGTYKIENADSARPRIALTLDSTGRTPVVTLSGGGTIYIDLSPLDTDECS